MNNFKFLFSLFIFTLGFQLKAQVVTSVPIFPTSNSEVVIYFHADEGNKALKNFTGDVYAHTGLITENSTSETDWKYVKTGWSENTSANKLTRISTNLYSLTIGPSIIEYYGIPEDEQIQELAFVFRNSDGSKTGKTETNGDIFYTVYDEGLAMRISSPMNESIYDINDEIEIQIDAINSDSIQLFVNNTLVKSTEELIINHSFTGIEEGKVWIKSMAFLDTEVLKDSLWIYVRNINVVAELPEGVQEGINYIDDNTVTLVLYAPYKDYVHLIGDFNDWDFSNSEPVSYQLNKTPDGTSYWITLENLEAGKEYMFQYLINGSLRIADPYTHKTSDPYNDKYIPDATYPDLVDYPADKTSEVVSFFQTAQTDYTWEITNFEVPAKEDLIIYELLLRDFTIGPEGKEGNIDGLLSKLDYLEELGVNAIELMPFNEFEGNDSWGYNPSFYFAPDKAYGTEQDYKILIDSLHKRGFAVIMDIVLNHSFGQSPMVRMYFENGAPSGISPWFNVTPKHDYNVGYDFNHESAATKRFSSRVLKFWLEEYNIDGYRFDLSKGLTQTNTLGNVGLWGQYDASRVAILKQYADSIWKVKPEAYVILEHFADNTEEKVLANYGMMLWGNMNHAYNEASMGYNNSSDLSWISYKERAWNNAQAIGYMESHDEERLMYKNMEYGNSTYGYNIKDFHVSIDRNMLAANFFFLIPGPKMIWQFGEMGYDYSIDYNGRTGKKPVRWDYLENDKRYQLTQMYQILINLKKTYPVFQTEDFNLHVGSYSGKRINLYHETMDAVVLGNFDVEEIQIDPNFSSTGNWYEYYTGEALQVENANKELTLAPGEYRIYTNVELEKPSIILGTDENINLDIDSSIQLYPNPARNELNILGLKDIYIITVYSLSGQKIIEEAVQADGHVRVNISNLSIGVYLIKCSTVDGQAYHRKFVKQL